MSHSLILLSYTPACPVAGFGSKGVLCSIKHCAYLSGKLYVIMGKLSIAFKTLKPVQVIPAADGNFGIENAKSVMTVIIVFFTDLITIIKTKNWIRLAELLIVLMRYGSIIEMAGMAWKELKDISQPETQELVNHFKSIFDISDDAAEAVIESAIEVIPRIYSLALSALDVVATGKDLLDEIKRIFGKEGEIAKLQLAA